MTSVLSSGAVSAAPASTLRRDGPDVAQELESLAREEALIPPPNGLLGTWRRLARLGRTDLVLGRVVEGHVDATAVLDQAGRKPEPDAFYGVWASGSGRTGLTALPQPDGWRVTGLMRFCTGARWIDRALVTARTPHGDLLLLDADVRGPGWTPQADSWPAVGMDLSESLDVTVDAHVDAAAEVGPHGFYLHRRGFPLGGIGVAAVWLGGAAGVLDVVADGLRRLDPDPHQAAHFGALHVAVTAADRVLADAALHAPELPDDELPTVALLARSAVDAAVTTVLERAPRITGPTPLCRDAAFAHRLADLQVYVRQHHAERDLAELGHLALDRYGRTT